MEDGGSGGTGHDRVIGRPVLITVALLKYLHDKHWFHTLTSVPLPPVPSPIACLVRGRVNTFSGVNRLEHRYGGYSNISAL